MSRIKAKSKLRNPVKSAGSRNIAAWRNLLKRRIKILAATMIPHICLQRNKIFILLRSLPARVSILLKRKAE